MSPPSLGEVVLFLVGDDTKLKETLSASQKSTQETMDKIGSGMQKAGGIMTATLTAPLLAIGVASIGAASDFEESLSKVQVVFGDAAGSVEEFASTAAESLGMSEQQALAAAGTYGNLFTAMGMGVEPAAEMSTGLITLASDLASFNNMDPTEVLEKLRAGLTGETEPLKSLGVNLNAAAVEAKAMELGLLEAGGELTASAKAQATYALVLEQTTNAQGDFARTSDGLANSQRIVKAQIADATATIGQMFLPYALQAVNAIRSMVEWFTNLSPEAQKTVVVVLAIVAAIGPLLVIVGTLITSISAIIPVVTAVAGVLSGPILIAIGAVIAIIALLAAAWKNNWFDIQGRTKASIDFIKNVISTALAAIQAWWDKHGDQIIATITALWEGAKNLFNASVAFIRNLISTFLNALFTWWNEHKAKITSLIQSLWDAVIAIFNWFTTLFTNLFSAFRSAREGDWYAFGEKLRLVWDQIWNAIKTIFSTLSEAIKTTLNTWIGNIKTAWDTFLTDLKTKWDTGWNNLKDAIPGIWENIKNGIQTGVDNAWKVITKFVDDMIDKFVNTDWRQVGRDIIQGIVNGIESAVQLIVTAATGISQAAVAAIRGFFNMKSPARKYMPEIGKNMVLGMIRGLEDSIPGLQLAMGDLSAAAVNSTVTNYNLAANYAYESPVSLITRVQMLRSLES